MRCRAGITLGISLLVAWTMGAEPPPDSPSADAPQVRAWIDQLASTDYRQRESASQKLAQAGPAALPALKQAALGTNPEAAARATAIVKQLERRPLPTGPLAAAQRRSGLRVRVEPGVQVVDAWDRGRHVVIRQAEDRLTLEVTGTNEKGEQITEKVAAASPEELRDENPEAYELYERWAGAGGMLGEQGGMLNGGPGIFIRADAVQLQLNPQLLPLRGDNLMELERRLMQQMRAAKTELGGQKAVLGAMRKLREAQLGIGANLAGDMAEYNRMSDALRQTLEALKLPDPGEALPPPARVRLGISVEERPDGLFIRQVLPDSRAQALGLKAEDAISTINGKAIGSSAALRQTLSATHDPLRLEIVRNGQGMTLEEKAK